MKFTNIKDLKYSKADNSFIDLLATCEEYGEMPMTLNLVDIEDLHTFVKSDGIEVPLEQYCKTLEIGAYIEPKPVIIIPQVITMRQARIQLLEVGLLDDVEALVTLDRKSQIEWEYASEVYKQSPLIEAVKGVLNLTDTQIDNMFVEASKL